MARQTGIRLNYCVVGLLIVMAFASVAAAQSSNKNTTENRKEDDRQNQSDSKDLQEQIRKMQSTIARLEAALEKDHLARSPENDSTAGSGKEKFKGRRMSSKKKASGMGMPGRNRPAKQKMSEMSDKGKARMREMSGKAGQGKPKKGMPKQGMKGRGMKMMGKMKSMGEMNVPSSLPGFPGASHIYHVGADGFFLDHAEHITLTANQQFKLNKVKEESMLQQADFDRQIEAAEQEIWVLTGADTPVAKEIETRIHEVTELQSRQRIAYIRAVGQAAQTLTEEQRMLLTGASGELDTEKE